MDPAARRGDGIDGEAVGQRAAGVQDVYQERLVRARPNGRQVGADFVSLARQLMAFRARFFKDSFAAARIARQRQGALVILDDSRAILAESPGQQLARARADRLVAMFDELFAPQRAKAIRRYDSLLNATPTTG